MCIRDSPRVVLIANLLDVGQFFGGSSGLFLLDISEALRRRDHRDAAVLVFVDEAFEDRPLLLAVAAPMRPQENDNRLALELFGGRRPQAQPFWRGPRQRGLA